MIYKALFILFFTTSLALAGDGLGMGGGPPADIINNPHIRPMLPIDSLNVPLPNRLILPERPWNITEGLVCNESEDIYHPYSLNRQTLERWPLSENADCLEPLKDFSKKLSLARAPLALSFATYIDGLEKHLTGSSLKWRDCGEYCTTEVQESDDCKSPTLLVRRSTQLPDREQFSLNKTLWDKLSQTQPRVCAATIVDLWLSTHVVDKQKRIEIVNDFFSAKFHANAENAPRCFDPTAATIPFDSLGGQVQDILQRIR